MISKQNNFDLIRLIAALQVVFAHSMEHMKFQNEYLLKLHLILSYLPGVPIFFTVSGFLIYASFDRNHDLKRYFKNRFLRIYPGLWICLLLTIFVLIYFGYINFTNIFNRQFLLWLTTQLTFFQFFTPDSFRSFGVRSPNGSLWTIHIELSFYLIIPLIFYISKKINKNINAILILFAIISVCYNFWYGVHYSKSENSTILIKLMGINLIPYLFYFILGSIVCKNWKIIHSWYEGKGLIWILLFIFYCLIFSYWLKKFSPSYYPNFYGFIYTVILSQTILSLAFTLKDISKIFLNGNDISYGIYLYHMVVINVFIQLGYTNNNILLVWILIIIIIISLLSWKLVEKPILTLKNNPLKKVYAN